MAQESEASPDPNLPSSSCPQLASLCPSGSLTSSSAVDASWFGQNLTKNSHSLVQSH
jgi:hypothetical protein